MIKKLHLKPSPPKRLDLYLIRVSKYDDDGYVIRHWKGTCPSNTLACLNGLSEDVRKRGALGRDLEFNIWNRDETVERMDIKKIVRRSGRKGTQTVVCLAGVQSNQFPRASDLALEFRKAGMDVLVGGFHVSGVFAMLPELSPEVQKLQNAGVTLVAGEVEGRWEAILRDALEGHLRPVYNFLQEKPDLSSAPMPVFPKNLRNSYVVGHLGTLDCSRGCPFACSFCTVINVQGRVMRCRPVDSILSMIRDNYLQQEIMSYFFTDDNFSRNKNWEAIFDGLIRLRREENISIRFMIQADTQSHRVPGFVAKAAEAGCSQVFIGLETLNEKNLEAAAKNQNKTHDFQDMIAIYHKAAIIPHLAYIIGFPFDSEESVALDIARLQEEFSAPQASFFMLTPLPGSLDHKMALSKGLITDADLNNFDSFHATFRHERMPAGAWARAYGSAWRSFYGVPHMIRILRKAPPGRYRDILMKFIWYKNSIEVEGGHPMLDGLFRLKSRKERRNIYPIESRWTYFKRRAGDVRKTLTGWIKLLMEMEEVWLATRPRGALEERVVLELSRRQKRVLDWRNLRAKKLQACYQKAAAYLEHSYRERISSSVRIPTRFQLWLKKRNVFSESLTFTRRPMDKFWGNVGQYLKQGKIARIRFSQVVSTGFRELFLFSQFLLHISKRSIHWKPAVRKR